MIPYFLNPDCTAGKHTTCAGTAWDLDLDQECACACDCHYAAPTDLERLIVKVDMIQATLDAILAKFDVIATEVQPMIDTISVHPLFKMFGGKKS